MSGSTVRIASLFVLGLLSTGCSATIDLSHSPDRAPVGTGMPTISTVLIEDARTEPSPDVVAVVSDLYGNPRAAVVTRRPLGDEVGDRITQALRQRNLLAAPGFDTLLVRIVRLRGSQRERSEVVVALTYRLFDAAGQEYFVGTSDVMATGDRSYTDDTGSATLLGTLLGTVLGTPGRYAYPGLLGPPGPFPSTAEIGALTESALTTAVDQALDHPDFIAALRRNRHSPQPGQRLEPDRKAVILR